MCHCSCATYAAVLKDIQMKRAVMNIMNNVPYCFLWSLAAATSKRLSNELVSPFQWRAKIWGIWFSHHSKKKCDYYLRYGLLNLTVIKVKEIWTRVNILNSRIFEWLTFRIWKFSANFWNCSISKNSKFLKFYILENYQNSIQFYNLYILSVRIFF